MPLPPVPLDDSPLFRASDLVVEERPVVVTCGGPEKRFILEVNGGGLVVGDFDLDGHLDLVTVNGSTVERVRAKQPALESIVWLGDGAGGFARAGDAWTLEGGTWGMGGGAGDVDGDGDPDLVITEWGRNRLYLNDGGRGFVSAKDAGSIGGSHWSSSCAFLDYDRDGKLDLYVVNYLEFDLQTAKGPGDGCTWKGHDVMCGPEGLVPTGDQLFRGNGDGTFVDVTESAGIAAAAPCFGLGVMTLDYDRDGDTDLYVANDSMPNHLWENQGDGTFLEVGTRRGVGYDSNGREQAGMGIGCGDVNRDGRPDLFVTNFSGERNAFYRSSRGRNFREKSDSLRLGGPSITRLGWGTAVHDYDLDGRLDISVVNGHVYPAADRAGTDTSYAQPDQLFVGQPDGRFVEQALCSGPDGVGRASVAADFDEDGDLDLVVVRMDGAVRFLENLASERAEHHWLTVELEGTASHPDAIGARVDVRTGDSTRSAEVRSTGGYQAGCSTRVSFGLGSADVIDSLRVHWPSGRVQELEAVAPDRLLRVTEDER